MRTETFYKITTVVTCGLLALLVLYQIGAGNFVKVASADPSSVSCVQGTNGIKGNGCDGTVTLQLGPGGLIKTKKGFGLQAIQSSAQPDVAALYGRQGKGSGVPNTSLSAGVWGDSDAAVGVMGFSHGNYGVVGYSDIGAGVLGNGANDTTPGVAAQGNGPTGIALEIGTGGLSVLNAGVNSHTPVFIHRVATGGGGNLCASFNFESVIDNPLTNGRSDAILIVTPNAGTFGSGVAPANGVYGVFYDATNVCGKGAGKWVIYTLNNAALPNNSQVNVLVVNP